MLSILGTCMFTIAWLFLSLGILVRLLPRIWGLFRRVVRGMIILSFRLYFLILTHLAPFFDRRLGQNILSGLPRVCATTALSLLLGLPLLMVATGGVPGLGLVLLIIHGASVGLAWDEIHTPGDLQLGAKIQ